MIIGSVVTIAGFKIANTLRKKRKKEKPAQKAESYSMIHNCSECSAECMLRDSQPPKGAKQATGCNPVKIKSDSF